MHKEKKKRIFQAAIVLLLLLAGVVFCLIVSDSVVLASGLVDDTVNEKNLYSKYPLPNYQLDFYVDNSWAWLPWNWGSGIGKSVMYGIYCITNFIWTINLYLSNATGYVVQEAYNLDFIGDMSDSIGKNMQTLAGVTPKGISADGFYAGFLLLLILIVGFYAAYTGLIKRETSKAIHAVLNFAAVFVISGAFIAYAPDYIGKINDFSSDNSTAALDLGTKIIMPDSQSKGKDSVDLIRDSLFSIQVRQPWLLLQYGTTDVDAIGKERVENLLSISPDTEDGQAREDAVKEEIETQKNTNMTLPKVVSRLGTVFFLFIFNLGITIFVFLLTAIMIFSQVLFIVYALFLPISFLLSMIPTYESMGKQALLKVFNSIMTRAGITLVITIAFSISTMLYTIFDGYPFFLIAFLQIITFAGIYLKLGDLLNMFSLQANDAQQVSRGIMRRPYMMMRRGVRRFESKLGRKMAGGAKPGRAASRKQDRKPVQHVQADNQQGSRQESRTNAYSSFGARAGEKAGAVLDTKNKVMDKVKQTGEQVRDMPLQARYAVHKTKEDAARNVSDFRARVTKEQEDRQQSRKETRDKYKQDIAQKRLEMQRAEEKKRQKRPHAASGMEQEKTDRTDAAEQKKPNTSPERERENVIKEPAGKSPEGFKPADRKKPEGSKSADQKKPEGFKYAGQKRPEDFKDPGQKSRELFPEQDTPKKRSVSGKEAQARVKGTGQKKLDGQRKLEGQKKAAQTKPDAMPEQISTKAMNATAGKRPDRSSIEDRIKQEPGPSYGKRPDHLSASGFERPNTTNLSEKERLGGNAPVSTGRPDTKERAAMAASGVRESDRKPAVTGRQSMKEQSSAVTIHRDRIKNIRAADKTPAVKGRNAITPEKHRRKDN